MMVRYHFPLLLVLSVTAPILARGVHADSGRIAAVEAPQLTPEPASDLNGIANGNEVRTVVRSVQNVTIGSEINARILSMPLREGDLFETGEVLLAFDCARTEAEFAAATAIYNSQKLNHEKAVRLQNYGVSGTFAVDQAKFEMQKAEADVQGLQVKKSACTIVAPFRGRVVEKMVQAFEVAQPNQPMMKIVEASAQELVLMVPSSWLKSTGVGRTFKVRLDETGQTYSATVTQAGGVIDPISQSVRIIAVIAAAPVDVAPGMSGTATFELGGAIE